MLSERWQTSAGNPEADAGAALLTRLSTLRFEGVDALKFLQGYLTCDLDRLTDGEPHLAALTNLQGRVVANGWCRSVNREIVDWLVDASLAETVASFMARYLAFSRTNLRIFDDDHLEVGLIDENGLPAAVLISDENELEKLLASHHQVPESAWIEACVTSRIALISQATSEGFLPQMLGLVEAGAVDFDKGCYLGQEVVARAQHRGEVKRRLSLLSGSDTFLTPGTAIRDASGREQGIVVMSAPPHCLAVLRTPAAEAYEAEGARLTPAQS